MTRAQIHLLFRGRASLCTPSGQSALLPGGPNLPSSPDCPAEWVSSTSLCPWPSPHPLSTCLPTYLPQDSWAKSAERGCSPGLPPLTTQSCPSLLLVKAFFSICPCWSCLSFPLHLWACLFS